MSSVPPTILSDYLTLPELAAELNKSPRTIDRWLRERTGPPSIKVGCTTLFPREGVIRWLQDKEAQRADAARPVRHRRRGSLSS